MAKLKNNPEVKRWLRNKKGGTRSIYLSAMGEYIEFTRLTPKKMIDEVDEDLKKPLRERGVVERRIRDFYQWLLTEYQRKGRGSSEVKPGEGKGLASKTAATHCGAIMGFYREFNYKVNIKIGYEFKPTPVNRRFNISPSDVFKLVSHAKTLRDRAIILVMFQSGMDVSTLCSLTYGHVAKEVLENRIPALIDIVREKEKLSHITFLARDSVEALNAYLAERKRKEGWVKLQADAPLFVKESWKRGKAESIEPRHIEAVLRTLAVEAGMVAKEEIEKNHWNPVRPHALRASFASQLRAMGVNEVDIDFMEGHKIPYQGAYYQREGERLRKTYADAMVSLEVFRRAGEVSEVEERLKAKIAEQDAIVSKLAQAVKHHESKEFIGGIITSVVKDREFMEKLSTNKELLEMLAASMAASISGRPVEKGKFIVDEEPEK